VATPGDALILTAGLGTRLRPLSDVRAKPALPVAGEPLVRHIIRWLVAQHVTRLTLNLHALPQTITAVVGDGRDLGARVRYSWEQPVVLGSAGGPRQALDIVGADRFFLINGDTLAVVDLAALARAHERTGALVTIALVPNTEFMRYGGVLVDDAAAVTGFVSRGPGAKGSFHIIGTQLVQREAFLGVPSGQPANTARGIYDQLIAARPGSVRGHFVSTEFWDVGTVADYWHMAHQFTGGAGSAVEGRVPPPSSHVRHSIIWDRVTIGERVELDECIVTDDVHVPAGARYRRTILMRGPAGELLTHPFDVHDA
jgi:NDP-sugar pyrophosphorylase family protein